MYCNSLDAKLPKFVKDFHPYIERKLTGDLKVVNEAFSNTVHGTIFNRLTVGTDLYCHQRARVHSRPSKSHDVYCSVLH